MAVERTGEVTWRNAPMTVIGRKLQPGEPAPDAVLQAQDWSLVHLRDLIDHGRVALISVVPSLDTGICDAQTRRFNQEAAALGEDMVILTVSADLPPAQKRWCGAAGVDRVQVFSDHLEMSFGNAYGTHMKERRLEQRAIFVVDREGRIRYVEYCPKVDMHPDYDAALAATRQVAGKQVS